MKKLLLSLSFIGLTSLSLGLNNQASAMEESAVEEIPVDEVQAVGGWSEDTGYWSNNENTMTLFAAKAAAAKHKGWHTYTQIGTAKKKKVHAETEWTGSHYSRARFEMRFTGTISLDSGRKFNVGSSKFSRASSTDSIIDDALAPTGKTYYGRK
ncbi:hypothetical protein ACI2JA_10865 [Alkalihalobacillus sp. NPDC078783]